MLSALCFLILSSDPDARHLGRYGPDGQVCSSRVWPQSSSYAAVAYLTGFAGDDIFAVFLSVFVGRPKMRCIMALVDQKESLLAVACARLVLLVFSLRTLCFCCRSQALMPCIMAGMDQMFLDMVVHTPVVCNDICLWFRLHKTVESPQLQSFLFFVIPVVAQMQILMVLHHRVSPAAVH